MLDEVKLGKLYTQGYPQFLLITFRFIFSAKHRKPNPLNCRITPRMTLSSIYMITRDGAPRWGLVELPCAQENTRTQRQPLPKIVPPRPQFLH